MKQYRLPFLQTLLCSIMLFNASGMYAVAQPGEDLRDVCAGISTNVDTILQCCESTFTAIATGCDGSGTFTAISALQSDLDACCTTLKTDFNNTFTAIASISSLITTDFNNTFTAIAGVSSLITNDFNNTMTALAALTTLETNNVNHTFTAIAAVSSLITTDFNNTMTVLAALTTLETNNVNHTFTALNAISNLITQDFNNTMTVLAAISSLITTDFNGTFTAIAATTACAPTPLSQATFTAAGGTLLLTTTGASYCLTQNVTGNIIISASDVTVDLNTHSLIGTIEVQGTAVNATIKNGNVKPAAPSTPQAAITIDSGALFSLITNCYIECVSGRDGINNAGTSTIINNCVVQAGNGAPAGNGGTGIVNSGPEIKVINSEILLSSGGGAAAFAFVANFGDNNVSVINVPADTPSTPATIPVGINPFGVETTPDGLNVFVANNGDGTVSRIDAGSKIVTATIGVGASPRAIAATPDNTRVYVANSGDATVTMITIATNVAGPTISLPGEAPFDIAITPDGTKAYVANQNTSDVSVIDTDPLSGTYNTVLTTITIGGTAGGLQGVAITPDGTKAYISSAGDQKVYPIIIAGNIVGAGILVGNGTGGIAITPDGVTAYVVAGGLNAVVPITVLTNTAGTPIVVGNSPFSIAITSDGTRAYVPNEGDNNVSVIDTNPLSGTFQQVIDTFAVGNTPIGIDLTPGGSAGIGGDGIVQNGNNGKFINTIISSGTNTAGGGNGIVISASTNFNIIENCISTLCGGSGFSMLTTGTVNILECIADYNTAHGFDVASSTGQGLIKACVASNNFGCGFNDRSASLYRYVANSSEGNGATPAAVIDTNYCISGVGSALIPPGPTPYFQFPPNTTGIGFAPTYWNNITLQ